jgi:acyl dehydratase
VNIAIGQSTWASQRVKANLFYRGLVLQRPVFLGDTLYTRTRVVGLRQNRAQAGPRGHRHRRSRNDHHQPARRDRAALLALPDDPLPRCLRRAPVTPDDLERIGAAVSLDGGAQRQYPRGWSVVSRPRSGAACAPPTLHRASASPSRPAIRSLRAPELVRLSLNMAMAHTDSKLSFLGERLVFGGHTIFMGFAQLTRALPNLLGLLAWESCDHVAPVVEGDRLRTACSGDRHHSARTPPAAAGALLRIEAECFAARGTPEEESRVLDWKFWAWAL